MLKRNFKLKFFLFFQRKSFDCIAERIILKSNNASKKKPPVKWLKKNKKKKKNPGFNLKNLFSSSIFRKFEKKTFLKYFKYLIHSRDFFWRHCFFALWDSVKFKTKKLLIFFINYFFHQLFFSSIIFSFKKSYAPDYE